MLNHIAHLGQMRDGQSSHIEEPIGAVRDTRLLALFQLAGADRTRDTLREAYLREPVDGGLYLRLLGLVIQELLEILLLVFGQLVDVEVADIVGHFEGSASYARLRGACSGI